MSNTPSSNTASEINSCELTLFIKDSVRGGCIFYLNHHLTCYKSFTEPHINHTPIISNQGPYTAVYIHRALGSSGGCSRSRRCRWSRRPRARCLGRHPPLPAALLPAHAAPPLSALRGYAGIYAAQVCGTAASTRSAARGSPGQAPARPPGTAPPRAPSVPRNPTKTHLPGFEAPFEKQFR